MLLVVLASLLLPMAGCGGEQKLETTYGRRTGSSAAESVNGTAVLGEMFEQAGHRVSSWRKLSPRLDRCDTIVWAPDDRSPPSDEACDWLEKWLADEPGRTLVYVGRDYDAEVDYWQAMRQNAPPQQVLEVQTRLAEAMARQAEERSGMQSTARCDWFSIEKSNGEHRFTKLQGEWSDGIDASKADLRVASTLDPLGGIGFSGYQWHGEMESEPLLHDGREVLVSQLVRSGWRDSKIIAVDNGSFLLNLPLVNHENRKLAARLIQECGPPGEVVFLESGFGGPPVGTDSEANRPTGLDAFLVWPINVLMMHLAILGIVFAVAMFPIFGRPHEPNEETTSDFGKHIHALGELLQRSGDEAYARQQLRHYHENVRRESGVSHRK